MLDKYAPLPIHSSDLFKALYDGVSDMVFMHRPSDGLVLKGNKAFREAAGLPDAPLQSLSFSQLFPGIDATDITSGNTVLQADLYLSQEKCLPVSLHIAEAIFEEELLVLIIAKENLRSQQIQRDLATADAEKKALLNEVYHRVKNNLNIIVSLLGLQLNRVQDEQVRRMLLESKSRVYTLALLQERLYHSPRLSAVKANEYLLSLAQSVIATFKERNKELKLTAMTEDCWLNVDVLVPLGLLVHELVSNATLHAFDDQESGEIVLVFKPLSENTYELQVKDLGKGLEEYQDFSSFRSLGAQLVTSLARQLKGQLKVESNPGKGTQVSLHFSI